MWGLGQWLCPLQLAFLGPHGAVLFRELLWLSTAEERNAGTCRLCG